MEIVGNTFVGTAIEDAMGLMLEAYPDSEVTNMEALISHVMGLTWEEVELYVTGEFAENLNFNGGDFTFFGEARVEFAKLMLEERAETVQDTCEFLTMVSLVRYVSSSRGSSGRLLYMWNERLLECSVSDRIGYDVCIGMIKWFVAFYDAMNEYHVEYESNGVFGSDADINWYEISNYFVNANNIKGIQTLIDFDKLGIDQDTYTGSYMDMFASRTMEPETLFAMMDYLGGGFEQNMHIFDVAFIDRMADFNMVASLLRETESSGRVNRESEASSKVTRGMHILQMILAHSGNGVNGEWVVSLPFKFLLWMLRSFGLQDTQLQADIVLYLVQNFNFNFNGEGGKPIDLFTQDGTFCGLEYDNGEYGKTMAQFIHLNVDEAQPLQDSEKHTTTFCMKRTMVQAMYAIIKLMFELFKEHFTGEVHGYALNNRSNCYGSAETFYSPNIYELYANKVKFKDETI